MASNELQLLLEHPEMVEKKPARVPVLILANKTDLENAMPVSQVYKKKVGPLLSGLVYVVRLDGATRTEESIPFSIHKLPSLPSSVLLSVSLLHER